MPKQSRGEGPKEWKNTIRRKENVNRVLFEKGKKKKPVTFFQKNQTC